MSLRIVCREIDGNPVIHLQLPGESTLRSFVIDAPEVEAWLKDLGGNPGYRFRSIVGIEVEK